MREKKKETKVATPPKEIHRIPFKTRINSQLSVARHYGGIKVNGKRYEFDREEVAKFVEGGEIFPDLVCYTE